ncbi:MAG: M48 family metalloprotease [Gemmatimonadetes bacterium]|nr:M48 family metalloprotease [Gemmatimonadota bacterium]
MQQGQGANVGLSLLCTLTNVCESGATQAAINIGGSALFARFSRGDEAQADEEAVATVVKAGISPLGIPEMFRLLMAARQSNPSSLDAFFASHPLEESRVAATEAQIAKYPASALQRLTRDTNAFQTFRRRLLLLPPSPAPRRTDRRRETKGRIRVRMRPVETGELVVALLHALEPHPAHATVGDGEAVHLPRTIARELEGRAERRGEDIARRRGQRGVIELAMEHDQRRIRDAQVVAHVELLAVEGPRIRRQRRTIGGERRLTTEDERTRGVRTCATPVTVVPDERRTRAFALAAMRAEVSLVITGAPVAKRGGCRPPSVRAHGLAHGVAIRPHPALLDFGRDGPRGPCRSEGLPRGAGTKQDVEHVSREDVQRGDGGVAQNGDRDPAFRITFDLHAIAGIGTTMPDGREPAILEDGGP